MHYSITIRFEASFARYSEFWIHGGVDMLLSYKQPRMKIIIDGRKERTALGYGHSDIKLATDPSLRPPVTTIASLGALAA